MGKENLIIKIFNRQYMKNGNIIDDCMDILGVDISNEFIVADVNQNKSLDGSLFGSKKIAQLQIKRKNYFAKDEK